MTPKHIMPAPADLPMVTSYAGSGGLAYGDQRVPVDLEETRRQQHERRPPAEFSGGHREQHRPHRSVDASRGKPEHRQQSEHVDQGGRV